MGHQLFAFSFFTLICIPGLCALTLVPSQNPVTVGSNVTISVNDSTYIVAGTWLGPGPSTVFMWYPGGIYQGNGYRAGISFNNSTYQLTLLSVTLKSSGIYVLDSFAPTSIRAEITLDVQEPVSNVTADVNRTNLVEFNDTVIFTCNATGTPLWFSWQNGSSAVKAGERVQLINNGRNLVISGVTRYDEGPFKCIVVNNVSSGESGQMSLTISYGPSNLRITASPENMAYVSGSAISLSCSADSKPTASFSWMYNGNLVNVSGPTYNLSNTAQNTTGLYTCNAQNAVTQRYATVTKTIVVVDPISAVTLNPSGSPVENMPFNLSCNIVGPVDSIQWTKNGQIMSNDSRITFSNNNFNLNFNLLSLSDDGLYQCAASNAVSNVSSQAYNLMVNYGPINTTASGPDVAVVGSNVTFSCSSVSRPQSQYSWYFSGSKVAEGSVYRTAALTRNHSGQYTCTAFNNITGISSNAAVNLTVLAPVSNVMVNMNNQQPILNRPFTLTCTASGDVENIQWMKNGKIMSNDSRITFSNNNFNLNFNLLSLSDDGLYQCAASNAVSNVSSQAYNLMVNYGPINTTASGPDVAEVGSNVTFSCSSVSRPQSQYSWYFSGSKVAEGSVYRTAALTRNHSGQYTCTAFNNITGISSNAAVNLTVLAPVSNVMVNMNNQQPILNRPFTLTCTASGDVEHIQWMKNGKIMSNDSRITFSNNNLNFNPVSLSDDGLYQCAASNAVSNATSLDYDLKVFYGPWNTTISGPAVGAVGYNVTFSCSASSYPTSQYSWFFNSSKVHDGPVYVSGVLSVDYSGQYTCMAFNNITGNSKNATVILTVKYPITHVMVNAGNQQPVLNQPFTLSCNAIGDVEYIQWTKNGTFLYPANGITFSSDNSTLSFQNLSLSDDGHYQCTAMNTVSYSNSQAYDLMVNYGPWNTTVKGPNMSETGSNVNFSCTAVSRPQSQYTWFFNSSKVAEGSMYTTSTLSLGDSGLYTCRAFNNITGSSRNASVNLTVIDAITEVKVTSDRLIPLASQSLQLMCNVKGPYNKIHWLRNDYQFQPSDGVTFSADNTTVTFKYLKTADDGTYHCAATNALKERVSDPYYLVVNFGPQSVQIIVHPGIPPKLTCQAVSQPPAVYYWILENNTVVGNQSTIEIPMKYILGSNYTCVAKNTLTNVTVYTSQVVSFPNAAVSFQASLLLMALVTLLFPVLEEWL
ncbi:carcinoembryonic antigen-related cell adhesion molecule 1 isoform X2 [Pseudorasbora parva]|uniref:carcinoembryonic antigen-related cell adhesion molecule 1 isoform X2 n=1 Tax=Pseudorasbora parva TaxID=51549 RepID=UPI00351DF0F0